MVSGEIQGPFFFFKQAAVCRGGVETGKKLSDEVKMSKSPLCLLLKELPCTPPPPPTPNNATTPELWLSEMADHLFVWRTADRDSDSDSDAACQSHLPPCCCTGRRWPSAPSFRGMPAEGQMCPPALL